jgi:hypothetical protein
MKNIILICFSILFQNACKGQTQLSEKLNGTWEETHREYIYQTMATRYEFTKDEELLNKGEKLVFTKDTLFAYVTYFTENTISPLIFENKTILTDTLEISSTYNLNSLLRKKGKKVQEITIKVAKNNGYKDYFDEYLFYLFEDGTLGQYSDFSLHYYKKTSDKPIGNWQRDEFGRYEISSSGFSQITLQPKNSYLLISYFPNFHGEAFFEIQKNNGVKGKQFPVIYENANTNKNKISKLLRIDNSWNGINISVGDPLVDSKWKIQFKFVDKAGLIRAEKSFIYDKNNIKTKMYLLKNDPVEIIESQTDWLKIKYYGKKVIEGWIKKSDVE